VIATCDPVCYYNKATPVAVLSQFNFGEIDMDKIQSSESVFVSALYKFVSEQIQDLKEGLEISNLPKFNMQNKYRRGELDAYTTVAYKIEGWRDEFDEPYADIPDVDGDIEYPAEVTKEPSEYGSPANPSPRKRSARDRIDKINKEFNKILDEHDLRRFIK
jgi:hypothetical protein